MGEATHAPGGSTVVRDALLQETYRLNHEIGYVGFREKFFDDPDAVEKWPDPAVREQALRGFWDGEGVFASYRRSLAQESVEVLTAYRDRLRDLLAAGKDAQLAHVNRLSELGRSERMREEAAFRPEAGGMPPASPFEIVDEFDAMPTDEELRKLYAEWKEDYAARRAEEAKPRLPSPSQIIADPSPYLPEPQPGHGRDREQ